MSAHTLVDLWSKEFAPRIAVSIPDGPKVTYRQLGDRIARVAGELRQGGIAAGDPVAIVLPNCLEFVAVFLGTTWARAIAAPLNPAYKTEEFRFYMEDAGARAVIVPPGPHPAREAAEQLNLPLWESGLDAAGEVFLKKLTPGTPV